MKTLLLSAVVVLFSFTTFAQSTENLVVHTDVTGKKYDWTLSNTGCYGCASFYWRIMRSKTVDIDGFYEYYMFFSTNSFYKDKILTSTYITDIVIKFQNTATENGYVAVEPFYILVSPEEKRSKKFESKKEDQIITVEWAPLKLLNK